MTVAELQALAVDEFPLSDTRPVLWKNFVRILNALKREGIICGIWIDGSFLTQKIDPDDVDFVVDFPGDILGRATDTQLDLIDKLQTRFFKRSDKLESFVIFDVAPDNPEFAVMNIAREQWKKDFGFSYIKKEPKGIALIEVRP
jgi:hypothetical protein